MALNRVQIIGYLGADPEIHVSSQTGEKLASISVATTERWVDKNNQPQERTEWHRITLFGNRVQIAENYLRKGMQVFVEGSLRTQKWVDQQGQNRYSLQIIGNSIQMLGQKNQNQAKPSENNTSSSTPNNEFPQDFVDDIDIPF